MPDSLDLYSIWSIGINTAQMLQYVQPWQKQK